MIKNRMFSVIISFAAAMFMCAPAFSFEKFDLASSDLYFTVEDESAKFGYVIPDVDGPNARFEAEVSYHQSEIDQVENVSTAGIMANTYYDFGSNSEISPYFGMGAGVTHVQVEGTSDIYNVNKVDTGILPAYQIMTGFSYKPDNMANGDVQIGYRYFSTMGGFEHQPASNYTATRYNLDNHVVEWKFNLNF